MSIVSRRRRLQLLAAWAVFLLLGASIYLGPYFAAWRIREAVAEGDTEVLNRFVDFAAVRENLKAELRRTVGASERARERREEEASSSGEEETAAAPDLSTQLAVAVGEALIDRYATPEGVDEALGDRPADEGWGSFLDLAGDRTEGSRVSVRAEYDGWRDFTVRLGATGGTAPADSEAANLWADILFERRGIWAWQVTGARVSPDAIPHLTR